MRYYITTPIYYVNDEPHIGHAYTTVAADVLARFHRQKGDDVFFLTGTDEHGNKVEQAAEERGLTPREHVDELAPRFREIAERLGASNDFFIRTTDPEHEAFVQQFVQRIYDAGDIYKRTYGGLYCTACEGYYNERDLVDGKCPDHGIEPVWMEEENYYFRLSKYQDKRRRVLPRPPGFGRAAARATTRRCRSSSRAWTTSPSAARASRGACRCRGTQTRSSTSGSTRSSTTSRR